MNEKIESHSPEDTWAVGRRIAERLAKGGVAWLVGPLGAGKTLLAKAIFEALGADPQRVTSPTFTLMNRVRAASREAPALWHLDLYRIERPAELESLGLEEVFDGGAVTLVEWGERLGGFYGRPDLVIEIEDLGLDSRLIQVRE